jgi:hypothetical protein
MPYGLILEFPPSVGEAEYDAVNEQLAVDPRTAAGAFPAGLLTHTAGKSDQGWVVSEIWETKEAQAAFMDSALGAAFAATHMPPPVRITWFELVANVHVR